MRGYCNQVIFSEYPGESGFGRKNQNISGWLKKTQKIEKKYDRYKITVKNKFDQLAKRGGTMG